MDFLFWSGGKDSYLALEFYQQQYTDRMPMLLTTYDESSGIIPHQNIELDHIRKQAETLELGLITVPLPPSCPNEIYLQAIRQALHQQENTQRLIFGDWHLEDIRQWREENFKTMGYECLFPIWQKSLDDLLPVLLLKPVEVTISAVKEEFSRYIRVGESYNQHFIRQLPREIDPLGENGEFHTRVSFKSWDHLDPSIEY